MMICTNDSLLSIQNMTGGGSPAGGRHCNTRETPTCTAMASILSFDHKGDPGSQTSKVHSVSYMNIFLYQWESVLDVMLSLTGLPDDDGVGDSRAVIIVSCTLVRSFVSFGLFLADVNDQSSRTGLHQDVGVFLQVEMGPVPRPREARKQKCILKAHSQKKGYDSVACSFKP